MLAFDEAFELALLALDVSEPVLLGVEATTATVCVSIPISFIAQEP